MLSDYMGHEHRGGPLILHAAAGESNNQGKSAFVLTCNTPATHLFPNYIGSCHVSKFHATHLPTTPKKHERLCRYIGRHTKQTTNPKGYDGTSKNYS